MSKFKIGDKVETINPIEDDTDDGYGTDMLLVGTFGTITKMNSHVVTIDTFDGPWQVHESDIKLRDCEGK